MPAPGRPRSSSALPTVIPQRVNNFISVDKYYRSARLLIRQANEYRAQHDDLQLYTMLMRLASLIVETIPNHKDYNRSSLEYRNLRQVLLQRHMPELEGLKVSLRLSMGEDTSAWVRQPVSHADGTVQLSASNLPELDWVRTGHGPPQAAQRDDFGNSSWLGEADSLSQPLQGDRARPTTAQPGPPDLPTFRHDLASASQASRDRHALLPKLSAGKRTSPRVVTPLYPQFEPMPLADLSPANSQPVPPWSEPTGMEVGNPAAMPPQSLLDAVMAPMPSPALPPQELQVVTDPRVPEAPVEEAVPCCSPSPDRESEPPVGGVAPVPKLEGLREVHISVGLMEEFLAYAQRNTHREIESCGILAGVLDTKRGLFSISTLIVPKQEGTSDTVQALAEEEIFDVQDKRGLYPMGWIHTHPTQTCFLSSIDVHTQCGYQTMLEEAIAIVMAPSDRTKRCGIFRLSTPGGLKLVQKCQLRGFHAHPSTETGQPVYELCGHVFLNERLQHDVIDLR